MSTNTGSSRAVIREDRMGGRPWCAYRLCGYIKICCNYGFQSKSLFDTHRMTRRVKIQ